VCKVKIVLELILLSITHEDAWGSRWVGSRSGLDVVERRKIFPLPEYDPSAAQSLASRYTYKVITAPIKYVGPKLKFNLKIVMFSFFFFFTCCSVYNEYSLFGTGNESVKIFSKTS
jgi:hypothetical protein